MSYSPHTHLSKYGSFKRPSFDDDIFEQQILLDERYQDDSSGVMAAGKPHVQYYDERNYYSVPKDTKASSRDRAPYDHSPIAISSRTNKRAH